MLSPPREPGRRYPVFVQVYGGPGTGRQATRAWGSPTQQYLVQHGWIVFSIDGRGSPDRGKAFENALNRAMGTVEVEDQLAGVAWLRQQDYVDPRAVSVFGWSYGGYMVLRLLEAAPGTFAAGVSVAPVTRWELYDTHYTERYLGNPATDPAPYAAAGVLAHVDRIADPLLLMHGMADDNVVFENSTVLIGALQAASRPFEMMVYPGATHSIAGEARQLHLWRTITGFLDRTVPARH
jgi:dipeptidyl-peptidase-4